MYVSASSILFLVGGVTSAKLFSWLGNLQVFAEHSRVAEIRTSLYLPCACIYLRRGEVIKWKMGLMNARNDFVIRINAGSCGIFVLCLIKSW